MNNNISTLDQFIEPAPVRFTFEAPGWYILAGIILLILLICVALIVRNYIKNKYRRKAIKALQKEETNSIKQKQYADIIYKANMIMKQICIQLYTREACAGLRTKDWLEFLNQTSHSNLFQKENEKTIDSIYLTGNDLDEKETIAFLDKTKQWIKKHKHAVVRSK